tara:strand:- start:6473 stop:6733 length:261 start_codon:yes stop_codon:yes gene_type:complete
MSSLLEELEKANAKIAVLEQSNAFTRYETRPAESLAGIAMRELGDHKLWVEIARLNSVEFPDMSPNEYYPVKTQIILPRIETGINK